MKAGLLMLNDYALFQLVLHEVVLVLVLRAGICWFRFALSGDLYFGYRCWFSLVFRNLVYCLCSICFVAFWSLRL